MSRNKNVICLFVCQPKMKRTKQKIRIFYIDLKKKTIFLSDL